MVDKRKEGLPWHSFDSSFVRFTPPPISFVSRVWLRAVNFSPRSVANERKRGYAGTERRARPGRWRSGTSTYVDARWGGVGRRPREISRLFFVVTFSNVVWRDHLRAARVFDKPVKARPRICLPLAFVTLLVLWLDSELTWKKGPRWYPEQTVRVCPGSTRRTPLSVTVACSPTANTQYRTDTFHRTSRPIIIRETDPNRATDLSFRHRPNNYYETRRESLSMEIRSEWI